MAEEPTTTTNGGDVAMTVQDTKALVLTPDIVKQAVNNKEDYEILNGAFLGNYAFEERKTLRDLKLAKIIDMF